MPHLKDTSMPKKKLSISTRLFSLTPRRGVRRPDFWRQVQAPAAKGPWDLISGHYRNPHQKADFIPISSLLVPGGGGGARH